MEQLESCVFQLEGMAYCGGLDGKGLPHGRGTLWLKPAEDLGLVASTSGRTEDSAPRELRSRKCKSDSVDILQAEVSVDCPLNPCKRILWLESSRRHSGLLHGRPNKRSKTLESKRRGLEEVELQLQLLSTCPRYEGRFLHGLRNGLGSLHFPEGEGCLRGNWRSDNLEGQAKWTFEDDSWLEGTWFAGELCGYVREYAANRDLSFEGDYRQGLRHGPGRLVFSDGGEIWGRWKRGVLECELAIYRYPNLGSCPGSLKGGVLVGEWKDGEMAAVVYREPDEMEEGEAVSWRSVVEGLSAGRFDWAARREGEQVYRFNESQPGGPISSDPLMGDPWEWKRVTVRESPMTGAGEGLFAAIDLEEGEVASFYSGVRLTHAEVDSRDWSLNSNTISLDHETVIDVPPAAMSLDHYCASLGHKANHSLKPNARYDTFEHPRLGQIKCVRTVRAVLMGEEITVDYGYDMHGEHGAPTWFLGLRQEAP